MKLDAAGIQLIKGFEGLRLTAYRDVAGVWTIGYGSTYYVGGDHVKQGDTLSSEAQADVLLRNTVAHYEQAVNSFVKVPLKQGQYNALVSFTYNEGTGALQISTLLKRLNAGDYDGAANEFLKWTKITDPRTNLKVECDDLYDRRNKERAIFLAAA